MKKYYFFIAVLLLHTCCQAQYNWKALPNAPKSYRCDDMFFLTPTLGWAINPDYTNPTGRIMRTTDGGATWLLQDTSHLYLRSIGFADSLTGWLGSLYVGAGEDTLVFRETTDGGFTWHRAKLLDSIPKGICGISIVTDSVVYAYGRFFGPAEYVKTTDKGATWTYVKLDSLALGLVDGFFYNKDTGFIGGQGLDRKAIILGTTDGGESWQVRYHATRADQDIIWKFSFPGGNTGYASVQYYDDSATYNSYFLKTTDRGNTWIEKSFVRNYFEQGIGFINDQVGWIGGDGIKPNYKTTDGGVTWLPDYMFGVLTPPYHEYSSGYRPGFSVNRFRKMGDSLMYVTGNTIYKLDLRTPLGVPDYQMAGGAYPQLPQSVLWCYYHFLSAIIGE